MDRLLRLQEAVRRGWGRSMMWSAMGRCRKSDQQGQVAGGWCVVAAVDSFYHLADLHACYLRLQLLEAALIGVFLAQRCVHIVQWRFRGLDGRYFLVDAP